MSITHKITRTWARGGDSVTKTESISCGLEYQLDTTIAASATDVLLAATIDVSEMKTLFIVSQQDGTLETNSSSSPVATVTLKAGVPVVWTSTGGQTNPFGSTDVTALYFTNAAASACNLQIRAGIDPHAGGVPD